MEKTIDEVIKDGIAKLPPYIKRAIGEVRPTEKMRLIGEKHGLHLDQQTVMEREVMLAMLGLVEGGDFVDVLAREGGVSAATAQAVATDISNQIFIPIREVMKGSEKNPPLPPHTQNPISTPPQQLQKTFPPEAENGTLPATVPSNTVSPSPVVKTPALASLASVDETLNKPQGTPAQRIDVGIAPAKPTDYTHDPYREPIE